MKPNALAALHLCALWCLFGPGVMSLRSQAISPAWVELGDSHRTIARIVVKQPRDCPVIQLDGATQPMSLRLPIPSGLRPVCEFAIPSRAHSASIYGQVLVVPPKKLSRVIVIGDTGCRVKGRRAQNCNDVAQWPFQQVAEQASSQKAELIVHAGDYLYRESPCPDGSFSLCGGTPAGDTWETWNADFFKPAARLLRAAPWVFTRGNHEDCERSWRGWFYYLDPRPWDGVCQKYSKPYIVTPGKLQLAVVDSSAVNEDFADQKQVSIYTAQLRSLRVRNAWLVDHFPFWGFKTDSAHGAPRLSSAALQELGVEPS